MRRLANSLLLIALVLPHARAPLCQAGAHEHEAHHRMAGMHALVDVSGEGEDADADCHSLMGCAVVLQASLPAARADFRTLTHASDAALAGYAAQLLSRASPDTPPPKTV